MATLVLTYADAVQGRVVDALCARGGWKPADGPKGAFAKAVLQDFVMTVVRNYEAEQDAQAARVAAITRVNTDVVVT